MSVGETGETGQSELTNRIVRGLNYLMSEESGLCAPGSPHRIRHTAYPDAAQTLLDWYANCEPQTADDASEN